MQRVNRIVNHMAPASAANTLESQPTSSQYGAAGTQNDNDVVVVSALRTAIGRAKKGGFRNTTPDTLLKTVLEATVKQTGVKYDTLGDICVGNVQLGGAYAGPARMAMFSAGYPETVPLNCVNRQCSSGLQAVGNIANAILAGQIDAGIGAGVESMTHGGGVTKGSKMQIPPINFNDIQSNQLAKDCLIPMGVTSENVASAYGVTRQMQDELAVLSNNKALKAQAEGRFKDEIVPVHTFIQEKEGKQAVVIDKDEGPRKSTIESLSKLRTVFKKENGTTTAGNSSQVSDGAAAVLLCRRSVAKAQGLPILGSIRGFQVVGVKPDVMGIGPAEAIPAVLKSSGISIDSVDIFEINEAFASQAVYCVNKLNIPMEKVNPLGGAIALGHPLGCTGARQVATLMHELRRTKKKLGVVSMCIGTGMGAAAVFEAEY
jgi:acetyl-CoA acyltransferase 1